MGTRCQHFVKTPRRCQWTAKFGNHWHWRMDFADLYFQRWESPAAQNWPRPQGVKSVQGGQKPAYVGLWWDPRLSLPVPLVPDLLALLPGCLFLEMGHLLSLSPLCSWAARRLMPIVRGTLGTASPAWECSPGPTRECVAMTVVAYFFPTPFFHCKSPWKSEFTGLFNPPELVHQKGMWEIFLLWALGRWGERGDSSLKTVPSSYPVCWDTWRNLFSYSKDCQP